MRTYVFHEYRRENETFCKIIFACSFGAQVEFFFLQKKGMKNSLHCPFKVEPENSQPVPVLRQWI